VLRVLQEHFAKHDKNMQKNEETKTGDLSDKTKTQIIRIVMHRMIDGMKMFLVYVFLSVPVSELLLFNSCDVKTLISWRRRCSWQAHRVRNYLLRSKVTRYYAKVLSVSFSLVSTAVDIEEEVVEEGFHVLYHSSSSLHSFCTHLNWYAIQFGRIEEEE